MNQKPLVASFTTWVGVLCDAQPRDSCCGSAMCRVCHTDPHQPKICWRNRAGKVETPPSGAWLAAGLEWEKVERSPSVLNNLSGLESANTHTFSKRPFPAHFKTVFHTPIPIPPPR